MVQFAEKQFQIDQRREEVTVLYPTIWKDIVTEWNRPGTEDCAWLLYSANYLFRTQGVRWAIDPLSLRWRVPNASTVNIERDLNKLDFVLLTHRHSDHLDFNLLRALRHLPIYWVIPEDILPRIQREISLPVEHILIPRPLQPIEIKGIRITPFDGLHWEKTADRNNPKGVSATAYFIELGSKRWLFPGDTRTYNASQLPNFGQLTGLFSHLWLGRGAALLETPPLLDVFCKFCVDMQPHRIVITHLEEFGRDANDYWDATHVQKIQSCFLNKFPGISIEAALLGNKVVL